MSEKHYPLAEQLRLWLLTIRHKADQADAKVDCFNSILQQLYSIGMLGEPVALGPIVQVRRYLGVDHQDSCQVYQSAVLSPGCIGVVLWDSEELFEWQRQSYCEVEMARRRFISFTQIDSTLKAAFLPELDPLLRGLLDQIPAQHGSCE